MFTKQFVTAQNAATDLGDRLADKARQEDGEVASQVIVMAMMVAVAAIVVGARGTLEELAQEIVDGIG